MLLRWLFDQESVSVWHKNCKQKVSAHISIRTVVLCHVSFVQVAGHAWKTMSCVSSPIEVRLSGKNVIPQTEQLKQIELRKISNKMKYFTVYLLHISDVFKIKKINIAI